ARGALPGRYPGILAKRAKLFAIASHSFETSSGGNSICKVEIDSGFSSTSTLMKTATLTAGSGTRKVGTSAVRQLPDPRTARRAVPTKQHVRLSHTPNAFGATQTSRPARDNLRS